MEDDLIMPARITIGFKSRRFSVFPDEITPFLKNCDDQGIQNIGQLTGRLAEIKTILEDHGYADPAAKQCHLDLIDELSLLIRGAIYEEPAGG